MEKYFHLCAPSAVNNYLQQTVVTYDAPYYYAHTTERVKELNNKFTFRTHVYRSLTGEDWKRIGTWVNPAQTPTYRPTTQPVSFLKHNDKTYAYFNHNFGFDGNVWVNIFEANDHDYLGWKDTGVILKGYRWIPTILKKEHNDYVMMTYDGGVWRSTDGLGWNLVQQITPKEGFAYCTFNCTYGNVFYIGGKWWVTDMLYSEDFWTTLLRVFYSEDCYTWHLYKEFPRDLSDRTLFSAGGWVIDKEDVYVYVSETYFDTYECPTTLYKSSIRNPGDLTDMGEWKTDLHIKANIPMTQYFYTLDGVYVYNGKYFYTITARNDAWILVTDSPAL